MKQDLDGQQITKTSRVRPDPSSAGGRPVRYDQLEYRSRNVIERGINLIKNWRAPAARYDKHALTYRGGIALRDVS